MLCDAAGDEGLIPSDISDYVLVDLLLTHWPRELNCKNFVYVTAPLCPDLFFIFLFWIYANILFVYFWIVFSHTLSLTFSIFFTLFSTHLLVFFSYHIIIIS